MDKINVLSLFDGMSCARLALDRAGIPVNQYLASEVDKYAIKVAMDNYPDTQQLGDIENVHPWAIPGIDLLIGGSPCQGFSFAGKQLNFDDPRSALFFEYVRILDEITNYNPEILFVLENTRMQQESIDVISNKLGVEPIHINSKLVSGQMRQRLYWTNIPDVQQPEDKGISYQSILDSDEARIPKAYACTATYYKKGGEPTRQRNFEKSQRPIAWINDTETRWLSPVEFERLQTIPDNYTQAVSNTQRYRMIGNGFTVDVMAHILRNIKKEHKWKQ